MAQACSYWHLGDIDKWSMCFLAKFETKPRTLMKVDLEIELAYINIFRICHSLSQIKTYCACWAGAANFTRRAYQDVPSLIGFVSSQTSERSSERSVRRYIYIIDAYLTVASGTWYVISLLAFSHSVALLIRRFVRRTRSLHYHRLLPFVASLHKVLRYS